MIHPRGTVLLCMRLRARQGPKSISNAEAAVKNSLKIPKRPAQLLTLTGSACGILRSESTLTITNSWEYSCDC